ncbi:MAG: T9SS type A sorting domain-containing protein, partial [Bacteroidota bacterium]
GLSVSHQYDEPGGYEVSLIAVDQNNCSDTIVLETAVQVSPGVQFEDVFAEAITVFLGDTIQLSGDVLPKTSYFLPPNTFTEDVFLPDGTGEAVEVIFNFDEFGDEDTLEVVDDEFSICITMEHSWMHDNEIEVECPNGQSILLQDQQFLGEIFQGIPDENDNLPLTDPTVNLPGTGYQYCWTNASTNGTWTEWFQANPSQNPTLPVGDYDSFEPLSGLEGCPLGGDWTLRIRDKWNIDNGWLFAISLGFNPELFPDPDSFATDAVVKEWEFVPGAIGTVNEQMMIAASTPGINDFTFKVLDNFGCALDTTIAVTVLDSTNCNLALEVDVASPNPPFGGFIDLSSQGGVPPYTFLWSNGATTEDIADLIEDTYSVTLTDALGCQLVATVFGEATSTTEISSLEEFTLAPNPSSERSMLTLRFNQPEALRLELVNALGQIVHQEAFVNVSFLQKEINLKAYPPGIYFVRLIANDEVSTQSLIRTD